jgi:predicted membrane-bound mannosyltransferase
MATRRKRRIRRPISARTHGVLDYTTSAAVAAAPFLFDMPVRAKRLFEGLAAGYTGLSSLTDYPLAAKRVVPFKAHGAAEMAIAAALPALPWVLGFARSRAARNLCIGLAAMTVVVAVLTDWDDE